MSIDVLIPSPPLLAPLAMAIPAALDAWHTEAVPIAASPPAPLVAAVALVKSLKGEGLLDGFLPPGLRGVDIGVCGRFGVAV